MSRLDLAVEWLDAPPRDEAFGPERSTWAQLRIHLDGEPLTTNHPADFRGADRPFVVGGMSGLADWIVDSWLAVNHEIHTPFPKVPSYRTSAARLPSSRDALRGWPDFVAEAVTVSGADMGEWQQRHTVGAARSDVAIPSIVLVPEGAWMGVGLDHVPAALSPTVRFKAPAAHGVWPSPPIWVPLKDVTSSLEEFVDETIDRAARDPASAAWAKWMKERWDTVRGRVESPGEARRWMFGELVAQRWQDLSRRLSAGIGSLAGVLTDSALVRDEADLESLASEVESGGVADGKRLTREFARVDWGLPPYREGYRLAQEVRARLKLGSAPLDQQDLKGALVKFGVRTKKVRARGLFRSAVWTRGNGATLALPSDDARFGGPIPSRFTLAAGLGRFLTGFEEGEAGGAAVGEQSRWRPTQLANAFAAELLLPIQAIERGFTTVDGLARKYGISRSAAEWHIGNRCPAEG